MERVDFALRRRFIWELHDYKPETLNEIIYYRLNKAIDKGLIKDYDDIAPTEIEDFSNKSTELNKKVTEEMGETYHIGHTFFAEIANLYIKLKENNTDNSWAKAKDILWQISIRPTLEAYCGTMEEHQKIEFLGDSKKSGVFYKAFFN